MLSAHTVSPGPLRLRKICTEDSCQLDEQSDCCDLPRLPDVLMSHDGLSNAFCLLDRRLELPGYQIKGKHSAVELEGHSRSRDVSVGSANVVQETS